MISEAEKLKMKEVLGHRFTTDVRTILLQNGIYTEGADTYSASHIKNVMNGLYDNVHIEAAIYDLYETRKKLRDLQELRKNALLSTKKPESTNSQV